MTFDEYAPEYSGDCVRDAWEASALAYQEEIKSLRQTITTLNEALTITSRGNFKLREQLAECEHRMDGIAKAYGFLVIERDELLDACSEWRALALGNDAAVGG
jgi:hypothetical protein